MSPNKKAGELTTRNGMFLYWAASIQTGPLSVLYTSLQAVLLIPTALSLLREAFSQTASTTRRLDPLLFCYEYSLPAFMVLVSLLNIMTSSQTVRICCCVNASSSVIMITCCHPIYILSLMVRPVLYTYIVVSPSQNSIFNIFVTKVLL